MIPETLAASAVTLLVNYLAKVGDGFAETIGTDIANKAGAVLKLIRNKFKGDNYAEETLRRVEKDHKSESARLTLKELILEKLKNDPDFIKSLAEFVPDHSSGNQATASGDRSVAIGGNAFGDIDTGDKGKGA
jgi:hypothetical protein